MLTLTSRSALSRTMGRRWCERHQRSSTPLEMTTNEFSRTGTRGWERTHRAACRRLERTRSSAGSWWEVPCKSVVVDPVAQNVPDVDEIAATCYGERRPRVVTSASSGAMREGRMGGGSREGRRRASRARQVGCELAVCDNVLARCC